MPDRCPRCRVALENPKGLVCRDCGYVLRLPAVGKVGAVFLVAGFLGFVAAIFSPPEIWVDVLVGGTIALFVGLAALLTSGVLIGRARRA